jgi:histidine phosphotransferase ChpT
LAPRDHRARRSISATRRTWRAVTSRTTVDPIGEGEQIGFRVAASGLNARMPQNIADLLMAGSTHTVDAHAVQPYYTRLLAQACGLNVVLAPEGDAVVVTAS